MLTEMPQQAGGNAGKPERHFKAPTHTRCRRTSMHTGVDNRLPRAWLDRIIHIDR